MDTSGYYQISEEGSLHSLKSLEDALKKREENGYIWISLIQPNREELFKLVETLKFHPVCVEDCLDNDRLPKVNEFSENTFLLFNTYHYSAHRLTVLEINFFLGENYLVTVSQKKFDKSHPLHQLNITLKLEAERIKTGPAYLMHILLDLIVDHKSASIEKIVDELIAFEDIMIDNPSKFRPSDLQRLRRSLLTLRKSVFHEREILIKICRNDIPYIPHKAIFRYRDIYDHLNKFFEMIEMERENATSLMQLNLSLINNQMAESANKTNASVRRLTLITTIFMPLTLITGIGGMSEFTMMTGMENWRIVYPVMMGVLLIIGVVNYFILKNLEKKDRTKA